MFYCFNHVHLRCFSVSLTQIWQNSHGFDVHCVVPEIMTEQIQSLLRHSMCAVVRAMAASYYWAMWGPVIFVVTRSSFSSFDVSLLIFDVWWFLIMILFDTFLWSPTVSVGCWILRCQVLLCMLTALAVMLLSEIKGLHLDRGDVAGAHWHRGWVKLAMKLPYDSGNNGSGYIHIWVTMFFWNKHPLASYFEVPRVSGFLTHKHILRDSMSPICSNQSMCFLLHPWLDFTEGSISPQLAQ